MDVGMNADEIVKFLRWLARDTEFKFGAEHLGEAAALIESLQAQLAESQRRERAAVEDLRKHRKYKCDCCYYAGKQCKYIPCRDCQSPISNYGDGWQWRGLEGR